jgi:hypothetical protein
MEGPAQVLISIAQAMRALGALSKDDLEAAKATLRGIRILKCEYSAANPEQKKQLDEDIDRLYQKLPRMFEEHYDLLGEAYYHLSICERMIDNDILGM